MDTFVLAIIHPTNSTCLAYAFVNKESVEMFSTDIANIKNKICYLCQKYNTYDVKLFGNHDFLTKIRDDLLTYAHTNYDINCMTVTIEDEHI